MTDLAIETSCLTRDFGQLRAVDDLTFEVPRGTIFGFLGPNGSGKTTTIRLLLGLLEPTAGDARVLGFDTRTEAADARRLTGALLEHPGLYERLSAEDNLDFYGRAWRIPGDERRARIKEMLSALDLWDRRKERVGQWSRGMKQQLAIARVLFHRPELVFLDEPTAGLDPVAAAALRERLLGLAAAEGTTVFLTTHNLDEAERWCDSVAVIRRGKLLAMGPPDQLRAGTSQQVEIVSSPVELTLPLLQASSDVISAVRENGHVLAQLPPSASIAPLVRRLVEAGIEVDEVRKRKASLEEVFLSLVAARP
jgi:ABC-2 type transport system ATP-binding protein